MNEQALSPAVATKAVVPIGNRGLILSDLDSLWRFSTAVSRSGLAPKGIESVDAIFVAVQMGLEIGLTPMAALQNIAVINGRPSLWGDAMLGVVRGSHLLEHFYEEETDDETHTLFRELCYTDDPAARRKLRLEFLRAQAKIDRTADDYGFTCFVMRKGTDGAFSRYTVADAKTAKLWGRTGRDGQPTPWVTNPARMLRFRARAFALRDNFGDVLRGLRSAEENMDGAIDIEAQVIGDAPKFLTPPLEPEKTTVRRRKLQPAPELKAVPEAPPSAVVVPAMAVLPDPEPATAAQPPLPAVDTESTPVEPPPPASATEPPVAVMPHALEKALAEIGYTYKHVVEWGTQTGNMDELGAFGNLSDLPKATADRLLRNIRGLAFQLDKFFEAKGGK